MKRYLFILFISVFCFYFLFSGLFGEKGFFYNKSLERQIEEKQRQSEKLSLIIENLKEQRKNADSEEAIRNSAVSLGYYVDGDTVYQFNTASLQDNLIDNEKFEHAKTYRPLSPLAVFLVAFGFSSVATFVIWLLSGRRRKSDDDGSDDSVASYNDNSDFYINA